MKQIADEPIEVPPSIAIYITDQSHECQRHRLPSDAVLGFSVTVYRLKGRRPATKLESHWSRTREQAERIADEYARQYCTMAVCGWT